MRADRWSNTIMRTAYCACCMHCHPLKSATEVDQVFRSRSLLRIVTMGSFTRGSASDTGKLQTCLVPCPRHSCATADYSSYFMLSFTRACFVAPLLGVVKISVVRCWLSMCLILHNESQVWHRAVYHRTWSQSSCMLDWVCIIEWCVGKDLVALCRA